MNHDYLKFAVAVTGRRDGGTRFGQPSRPVLSALALMMGLLASGAVAQSSIPEVVAEEIANSTGASLRSRLQAVQNLWRIGRVDAANKELRAIAEPAPSRADMLDAYEHFGSAFFLELATDPRIGREASRVNALIFAAVRDSVVDPKFMDVQMERLRSNDSEQRRIALGELRKSGADGVARLIQRLKESRDRDFLARGQSALRILVEDHPQPAIAALYATDPHVRTIGLRALRSSATNPEIAVHLLWPLFDAQLDPETRNQVEAAIRRLHGGLPSRLQAETWLIRAVDGLLVPGKDSEWDGWTAVSINAPLWVWNEQTQVLSPKSWSQETARYVGASRLAEDLIHLSPENERHHERYLFAVLAAGQSAIGLSQPLDRRLPEIARFVDASPPGRIQAALQWSLEHRCVPVAIAACQRWPGRSDSGIGFGLRSLNAAVVDPNARVRMAALEAVLRQGPSALQLLEFDGWKSLQRLLATQGVRRILVVDPDPVRGSRLAGLCRSLGWGAESTPNARTALRLLHASADFEFVLVHEELGGPRWTELWQQLRFNWQTAELPIAILQEVNGLFRIPPHVDVGDVVKFPHPVEASSLRMLLASLQAEQEQPVSVAERSAWAAAARTMLKQAQLVKPLAPYYAPLLNPPVVAP